MLRTRLLDSAIDWRQGWDFDPHHQAVNPFVCHFGSSQKSTTQTQTSTSQPWSGQQPYLTSGFQQASDLLGQAPPTQSYPVAPLNSTQTGALTGIENQAQTGSSIVPAATNFATSLENGDYLNANPANGYFSSLAGSNLGLTNPAASTLSTVANGGGAGSSTLNNYANGGYFSNGYSDDTAKAIAAQVIPQVAGAFNNGNAINNPAAAYAAANGVTAALAPVEYSNYQTQEGLQQNAANSLAANQLTGANSLESGALAGGNLQATGASGLGSTFQDTLAKMVQGNALAPQNQQLGYSDLNTALQAGTAQQTQAQNEATGAAQASNYAQLSPYQQLQAYMSAIGGNYGQSTTGSTTTPYFQNGLSSTIGGLTGLAGLGSALGIGGSAAAGTGLAGALAPLLAFL